jgi:hypothetical protein
VAVDNICQRKEYQYERQQERRHRGIDKTKQEVQLYSRLRRVKTDATRIHCLFSVLVLTMNQFFKWNITNDLILVISRATPLQPLTITYVMKNVAFIGTATPKVLGILQKKKAI